jgi:CheY-like chemotaxis protein
VNAGQPADISANKHVFVINGAAAVLELIRVLLEEEAYNVTTTNFVPRTWDQISVLQPDLLMIDLVVGQRQGWDLLEQLQQHLSTLNIPVIIFSTDACLLTRAEEQAQRYGGQRFVAKPFDIKLLLGAVHDLIGQAAPTASAEPVNT